MPLTFLQVKEKLQPFILRVMNKEISEWIFDDELVDACNEVARDLNVGANIRTERYYYKTTADQNNYELDGDIVRINQLLYIDTLWYDQVYAIVQTAGTPFKSTIVFKTTPTSDDIQLDIYYLRQVLDIEDSDTDEIDLPDSVLSEFMKLMRRKLEVLYGGKEEEYYDLALERAITSAYPKIERILPAGGGTFKHWLGTETGDDGRYDIQHNQASSDLVQVNEDSTYTWLT